MCFRPVGYGRLRSRELAIQDAFRHEELLPYLEATKIEDLPLATSEKLLFRGMRVEGLLEGAFSNDDIQRVFAFTRDLRPVESECGVRYAFPRVAALDLESLPWPRCPTMPRRFRLQAPLPPSNKEGRHVSSTIEIHVRQRAEMPATPAKRVGWCLGR